MSQTIIIIYLFSILPLLYNTSMTYCPQLTPGTISLTSDLDLSDDSIQYRCYIGKIVNKQNINKLTFVLPNISKDMLPMALCWPVHGDML